MTKECHAYNCENMQRGIHFCTIIAAEAQDQTLVDNCSLLERFSCVYRKEWPRETDKCNHCLHETAEMNLTKILMSIRNQTKIYILCKGVCVLSQEFVVATAGLYLPVAKILLSQPLEHKKVGRLVPITAPNFERKLTIVKRNLYCWKTGYIIHL